MKTKSPSETAKDQSTAITALSGSWTEATRQLWDLHDKVEILPSEWNVVLDWLLSTNFDHRNFIAAETAVALIRDRAPTEIRDSLQITEGSAPESRTTFRRSISLAVET